MKGKNIVCVKYKVRERQPECEKVCETVYISETEKNKTVCICWCVSGENIHMSKRAFMHVLLTKGECVNVSVQTSMII